MSPSDISTTHAPLPREAAEARAAPRTVWVLASYRAGENTQLLGLAERIAERIGQPFGEPVGEPFRVVSVRYRRRAALLGLLRLASLGGIAPASRAEIEPPSPNLWPDLIVTAGLRNEPICAWIRRASGGRTRIVFVGRTWAPPQSVDLLVTTPQYRVPPGPRVLVNLLTQHRVTRARLAEAVDRHGARLSGLNGPVIAVLVGGSSGPYVLGPANAKRLAADLVALREATGGALALSSSSRTPAAFWEALEDALGPQTWRYRWKPDDPDNPYYALLGRADALVVTGDSVAMLSESAATGKPVLIFDIPTDAAADTRPAAAFYRWMMRWLPRRLTRDVGLFHRQFVAAGHGQFLGAGGRIAIAQADGSRPAPVDQTVERVLALFDSAPGRKSGT
jgi:mitochondrial fission protein ELM1